MSVHDNSVTLESVALYTHCQSEDRKKQEEAYALLWQHLFRIAHRVVHDQTDASELAADCTQDALARIHTRIAECKEPKAFLGWSRRIVTNLALDELRRRTRRHTLMGEADEEQLQPWRASEVPKPEEVTLSIESLDEVRTLLNQAPISDRSRRLVSGRYLDDLPDEQLAKVESELSGDSIRPSHLQVTRSKNMSKLRQWEPLHALLS